MAAPPTIHTADGIDALKFFATTTEVTVHREGESPVFSESAVKVRIDDEGGGAFIVLEQMGSDAPGARRVMKPIWQDLISVVVLIVLLIGLGFFVGRLAA